MDRAEKRLNALPCRSLRLVMIDANAPLGQHEVSNDRNECLIGNARPQYEEITSPRLRQFVTNTNLQVINTIWESGAGPTYSGGKSITSRIDYIMTSPGGPAWIQQTTVGYREALRLQNSQRMCWRDHAPFFCRFTYR